VTAYLIRRLLYALPLLMGINILTFVLFFVINTPDDMARMHLGQKHVTAEGIAKWKHERGYDLPLFWNAGAAGSGRLAQTIFWQKSLGLFAFRFGRSDAGRDIGADIRQRMWPSLAIAVPSLVIGLSGPHHAGPAPGVLPPDLSGKLGRRAVRGLDVGLHVVLHHRRSVCIGEIAVADPDIRLR